MIDVTERIKSLTNNYKITKKENMPSFVDICKQLKYTTSSQTESVRSMRLECTKVLNSTVKKNILRDFLSLDGLSIVSEWITNCSDHVDETMMKDLISIVSKLNQCGGLDVSIIKKSKIGKILSSISKSTNFSKTIKTSVDELIQDWKQKFVKESAGTNATTSTTTPTTAAEQSSSPVVTTTTTTTTTIPKKKPSSSSSSGGSGSGGEKRKRSDDQSTSPTTSSSSTTTNTTDNVETMPKKVKSSESNALRKKKKVSWSTELERIKLIEPRQAYVEEISHKSVQELMNAEKSNERVLLTQQKQMKLMILSNMRNTVNYVTPLRILLSTDRVPMVSDFNSSEAKIIGEMVKSCPSIIVTESPSSPLPLPVAAVGNGGGAGGYGGGAGGGGESTINSLLSAIRLPPQPSPMNTSSTTNIAATQQQQNNNGNRYSSSSNVGSHNPYQQQQQQQHHSMSSSNNNYSYPPPMHSHSHHHHQQQPHHHHQSSSPYHQQQHQQYGHQQQHHGHHQQSSSPYQRTQQPPPSYYQTTNSSNRSSSGGHQQQQQHYQTQQQHHSYGHNSSSATTSGKSSSNKSAANQQPYSSGGSGSGSGASNQQQHKGEPRSFKPIKCLYYAKGQCKNGSKCQFYHEGYDQPCGGIEEYDFEKAKFYLSLREKKR